MPSHGIPARCIGKCPLERIDQDLLDSFAFLRNCDGPSIIDETPVDNEFDIRGINEIVVPSLSERRVGQLACTNKGVTISIKATRS